MSKPVNIINHSSVIPRGNSSYRETFHAIRLPKGNTYKITSITCKIDTTSLWNIPETNHVVCANAKNELFNYYIPPGYYDIDGLCATLNDSIDIDDSDNAAYVNRNVVSSIDLTKAPDIARIFRFPARKLNFDERATKPYDITNGTSVIKVYSSIMKQVFGIKSSFIDNLIHVSPGLNNIVSYDNLNIDVSDNPNLDYIQWTLTDAYDRPIQLTANVYINFTISCFAA